MDKTTFNRIFNRARKYALSKRVSEQQAEDFAQHFLLTRYVRNKDQNMEQCFVDFLRLEHGDTRCPGNVIRSKASRSYLELNEEIVGEENLDMSDWKIIFEKYLDLSDFKIVDMRLAGYDLKEIGTVFGVTYGRISQRLKKIKCHLFNIVVE